jgi:hypothetical protein
MSLRDRIDALRTKHASLDRQLEDEVRRPLPSTEEVNRLKRMKLQIKDELARLNTMAEAQ